MTVVVASSSNNRSILHVAGALGAPVDVRLRHEVRWLLCWGKRAIVLDLSAVTRIDAAGVGELVRAYNMARAVNGALRIARPAPRVRVVLARAGLLDLLSSEPFVPTNEPAARWRSA